MGGFSDPVEPITRRGTKQAEYEIVRDLNSRKLEKDALERAWR